MIAAQAEGELVSPSISKTLIEANGNYVPLCGSIWLSLLVQ